MLIVLWFYRWPLPETNFLVLVLVSFWRTPVEYFAQKLNKNDLKFTLNLTIYFWHVYINTVLIK